MLSQLEIEFLLEVPSAMLFKITPNMRYICMELSERTIIIHVYYENQPTDIEHELIDDIADHIIATSATIGQTEYKYFVTNANANEIKRLKFFVYARYENFDD